MFDVLKELMVDDDNPVGFVIMSGNNTSLFMVVNSSINRLATFDIDLPSKHHMGGQSSVRFERLAEEARHNYITKMIELIIRTFKIDKGFLDIIIGGPAYLKNKLAERLSNITVSPKILKVVDCQYDKLAGLRETLSKCTNVINLANTAKERQYVNEFLESFILNNNLGVYGEANIKYAIECGLLKVLLVDASISDLTMIKDQCEQFDIELIVLTDLVAESEQVRSGFGNKVGIARYPITFPEEIKDSNDESLSESYEWE